MESSNQTHQATLGGGCFWCLDPVFSSLQGVSEVVVGYAGGRASNPTYQQVCTGTTGHAEVVQITYNPEEISFRELLGVFFSVHDPTTPNRQGADVGTQYRSIILYHDDEQRRIAEAFITELDRSGVYKKPVVTELAPLRTFYRAEEYHQDYYAKNPYQGYCQVVIAPKMAKFRKHYADQMKTGAAAN